MSCYDGDEQSNGGIATASVGLYLVTKPQQCQAYRLPTESEWEFAARAETLTALPNGGLTNTSCGLDPNLDAIGWYCGNSAVTTNPVASKEPNDWGLYDMTGNVLEWTWDRYASAYPEGTLAQPLTDPHGPSAGSNRVLRGGSFSGAAAAARSGSRDGSRAPSYRSSSLGLRLVRTVDPGGEATASDEDSDS
jgi:formylglycine-generating enzyme required for sulfatase activity